MPDLKPPPDGPGHPIGVPRTPPAAERTAQGVQRMFDRVAPRYDLANTVFSLGQDKAWRQAAARATRLAAGEVAVDVACGTGALTRELQSLAPGAVVVGLDFSQEMLKRARPRGGGGGGGGGE
jgi:demethylmenaquinone methyltransferase / 2-methoxy-6-polyprenyl-1,4-benzoquinol methylase